MENQVPDDVVKDRFDRLLKEVQDISAEVCSVHEGTTQAVLVESMNDHDDSLVTGRMSNNLLVHFPGTAELIGKIVDVHLLEAKGFYYMGEMVQNHIKKEKMPTLQKEKYSEGIFYGIKSII